jgi:hypothetical protein
VVTAVPAAAKTRLQAANTAAARQGEAAGRLPGQLARAFPVVPLLRRAGTEVAVLAEMAADDAAARRYDRGDLAAALVVLGTASVRAAALTAGGPAAVARVQRLLAPARPPRRFARIGGLAVGSATLAGAAVIACLPVLVMACDAAGML